MFSSLKLRQTLEISVGIFFFFALTILGWLIDFKSNSYLYILNTHNSLLPQFLMQDNSECCRTQVHVPNTHLGLFGLLVHGTMTWVGRQEGGSEPS